MYRYAAYTDKGPVFEVNDDRVAVGNEITGNGGFSGVTDEPVIFAGVADGVGGLSRGYEAAEITLRTLTAINKPGVERTEITDSIEKANRIIRSRQTELNIEDGLRTTLAAIYIDNDVLFVINAGDSRVYRLRDGRLEQLSKDHSVVQNYIDTGKITEEESYDHPKRNVITKCIGDEDRVNARIIDLSGSLRDNDMFMLCSDGISDCIRTPEAEQLFMSGENDDLGHICRSFVQKAIENGSTDNISICLVRREN